MQQQAFQQYAARLRGFIARCRGTRPAAEEEFAALAQELFALQFEANMPFRALCEARGVFPDVAGDWRRIPAVPAAAFKDLEITCLIPPARARVFHSSGTTEQRPSRHFHSHESLALYAASLRPWFRRHVLAGLSAAREAVMVSLTPPPAAAPNSSLVHMLEVVMRAYGARDSRFLGRVGDASWELEAGSTAGALVPLAGERRPVVLLGTAFNFVHLLDHLEREGRPLRLPAGSRVMETGGYKGRSRMVPRAELHAGLTRWLGIPGSRIVSEYGMSELSSQAYAVPAGGGAFHFPPWARALVVSPESGHEVAEGESGLLRIVDLANAWSVLAVQTEDLAIRRGADFELLGRAGWAENRGCSLMTA